MKKALLLTRHAVPNYGSLLQTYATVKLFERFGIDMRVLNYVPELEKPEKLYIPMMKNYRNPIKRILYLILRKPDFSRMGKKFLKYADEMFDMTKEYNSVEDLSNDSFESYDLFVTGGDQVWGTIALSKYDPVYFWSFIKSDKIISYSSSFGMSSIDDDTLDIMRGFLNLYAGITVRENSGLKLLSKMGIDGKQVIDPVLMLSKDDWTKQMSGSPVINEKYILVYQVHDNKKLNMYAKELAKRLNLKLVRVSNSYAHVTRGGKFIYLPDQKEFLRLFSDASYVITNSFHATVFSLIFNIPFIVVNSGKTNTRIESLLKMVCLENRQIKNYDDYSPVSSVIDFEQVNRIIQDKRGESNEIVERLIKTCDVKK